MSLDDEQSKHSNTKGGASDEAPVPKHDPGTLAEGIIRLVRTTGPRRKYKDGDAVLTNTRGTKGTSSSTDTAGRRSMD